MRQIDRIVTPANVLGDSRDQTIRATTRMSRSLPARPKRISRRPESPEAGPVVAVGSVVKCMRYGIKT